MFKLRTRALPEVRVGRGRSSTIGLVERERRTRARCVRGREEEEEVAILTSDE
jgi:hypothetical protein